MAENIPGLVGKLTIKTLGCDPSVAVAAKKAVDLCRVYGFCTGTKISLNPKDQSPMIALKGEFEGVNLETGEIRRSGIMYLPSGIQDMLSSRYENLTEDMEPPRIRFGLTIASFPSTAPIGYSYQATPFEAPGEDDPLHELRQDAIALGAPKTKAIAAPSPAAEKKKK